MDYKPSDFFVGVVDFFAVLLPGALVAALIRKDASPYVFGTRGVLPAIGSSAEGWLTFVIAAYLIGSLLFLVGAFLDALLYDPLRKVAVPTVRNGAYTRATELKQRVLPSLGGDALNTFQWARATLRLRAPEAVGEVERYEADSKFFRSVAVSAYALLVTSLATRAAASPAPLARLAVGVAAVAPVWLVVGSVLFGARAWLRVGVFGGIILLILALAIGQRDWQDAVLAVAFTLSTWRYGERRWKSTRSAYNYCIILYDQDPPREPAKAPSVTPASAMAAP